MDQARTMARLTKRWNTLWSHLTPVPSSELLAQLLIAWREPQRHYHTLQHLEECLALFDTLRHTAQHPHEIELALWFHDAVYDVRATTTRNARRAGRMKPCTPPDSKRKACAASMT